MKFSALTTTNLSSQPNYFALYVQQNIIEKKPIDEYRVQKVGRNGLRCIACIAGFAARMTVANVILKFAGKRVIFGVVLVTANTITYGSLISWCLLKIVNSITTPISENEKRLIASRLSFWQRGALRTILVCVGVFAQIPLAYVAYEYNNKNIIFPLVLLCIDSAYPVYSLFLTSEEVLNRSRFSSFERKIYDLKKELINCLNKNRSVLISTEKEARCLCLEKLLTVNEEEDSPEESVHKYFAIVLNLNMAPETTVELPEHYLIRTGRYLARTAGLVLTASQLFFIGNLGFKATKEMTDYDIFCYSTAIGITACSAYLGYNVLTQSFIKIYDYGVSFFKGNQQKTLASVFHPKLRLCLQLITLTLASLSFAGPLQVSRDQFTGGLELYMIVTSIMEIVIITSYVIFELIDDVIEYKALKWGEESVKQLVEVDQQMRHLITLIERSPFIEFIKLLEVIPSDFVDEWKEKLIISSEQLEAYVAEQTSGVEVPKIEFSN